MTDSTIFINDGHELVGQILATLAAGVAITQAFDYFMLYTNDSLKLKTFVGVLIAFLIFSLIGQSINLYETLITNSGNASPHYPPIYFASLFSNVVALTMSQLFFVRRAYASWDNSKILLAVLVPLAVLNCITEIIANIYTLMSNNATTLPEEIGFLNKLIKWVTIGTSTNVATEILISFALGYKFYKTRQQSKGFNKSTDGVISALLQMTIGTAALQTIQAVYVLVCIERQALGATFHLILSSSQTAVAVSSCLYCLNSRQRLRLIRDGGMITGTPTFVKQQTLANPYGIAHNTGRQGISIHLETFVKTEQVLPGDSEEKNLGGSL